MTTTTRNPGIEIKQAVPDWQLIRTDREPFSLPIFVGQKIFCGDRPTGRVIALLSDTEGSIQAFAVQTSGWFGRQVIVPLDWIDEVEGENVYLLGEKSELNNLSRYRSDDALTTDVNKALWGDFVIRRTQYRQIHVKVKNSIVYLQGYVSTPSMKIRAEKAALRMDGSWKVENRLIIDIELKLAVAQAIGKDPRIQKARIFVGAHNGFITLTGEVSNLVGRAAAQEQAVAIPDVRGVLNSIQVPGVDINIEDQRALQPIIGAGIYATAILIGIVEKVVINPDNRLVTAILANAVFPNPTQMGSNWLWNEHLYLEGRIIIPIDTVRHQSESDIFLKVKESEAAAFDAFDASSYSSPDEDWQPPYPYKRADVLMVRNAETA